MDERSSHIQEIKPREQIAAIGTLVRRSFATVAEEFSLTAQNCPYHPAFLSDKALLRPMVKRGVTCLGVYVNEEMAAFAALVPKGRYVFELTRLCAAPEHRHSGLGGLLLAGAVRIAQERGGRKIEAEVISENAILKQ